MNKMHFGCYCGAGFELGHKKMVSIDGVEQFCTVSCLLYFLTNNKNPEQIDRIAGKCIKAPLQNTSGVYDRRTGIWFRSGYELVVANFFSHYGIPWVYESRIVTFPGEVPYYLPDFLLPKHGYFVEVKGRWTGKGRRKVVKAAKIFPFILIQDYLVKDIKRNAIHT